jgi:hypothetical protein
MNKKKRKIRVAHATPGWIRLKVPHGKGDVDALNAVADSFRGIPGIERVETNPVTGGVVLIYGPDRQVEFAQCFERSRATLEDEAGKPPQTDIDKLASTIEREAEFLAQHSAGARAFVELCRRVDHDIKVASGNNVDLKLLLAAGIVAATVLEIGATAATPVWVTLVLFGANHFVELHQRTAGPAKPAEDPH